MKFLWFCLGPNKHQSAVTCLQFNKNFVITSSDDGTVKLWDLKTGEFIRNLVTLESGGSGGVVWRIRASNTKLVCAVGSRNGTEETKLLVLDFDVDMKWGAGKGALSPRVGDRLPALPPAKEKKKKKEKEKISLVLSGAGCWLGATERKDLQTQKEKRRRWQTAADRRGACRLFPEEASRWTEGSFATRDFRNQTRCNYFFIFFSSGRWAALLLRRPYRFRWPVLLPLRPRKKLQ